MRADSFSGKGRCWNDQDGKSQTCHQVGTLLALRSEQEYVDRIEAKIAFNRERGSKLILWSRIIRWAVIPTAVVLGAVAMMTVMLNGLYRDPLFGRPVVRFLIWFTENCPGIWTFLTWLGPPASRDNVGSLCG